MLPRLMAVAVVGATLMIQVPYAAAEDIDLFVQPTTGSTDLPNVLIIVDNTANWGRNVGGQAIWINEQDAIVDTLSALPPDRFRIGLMLFNETGGSNNSVGGGYIRAAIRDMNASNKAKYAALFSSLDVSTDRSSNGKAGLAMAEAWRYFKGQAPYAGNGKVKTDYANNTSGSTQSNAVYALAGNALNSKNGSPYNSPLTDGSCAGNYIIYISNGAAQDSASDIATGAAMLTAAAASEGIANATTTIPLSPSGSQVNLADEWAHFMEQSSLAVKTYTVDVDKITTGQGPGWSKLLQSIAIDESRYFSVTSGNGGAEIASAIGEALSEIQAVNSVFASVTLPVSINTQGTFLNQVYIGMFRPDSSTAPLWTGNLKQYKLGIVSGALRTLDADDDLAINSLTGFITECARSFWTPSTVDTYWSFNAQGGCLAVPNSNASNFPDGNIVEKGGQAYRLRSSTTRTLQTCDTTFGDCTTLTTFDENNNDVTSALLGAATDAERLRLIRWQRGLDQQDEDNDSDASTANTEATEMRPSVHGDVVHSRPSAINFGTAGAPKVVVFYGGNDGILRAVNGNRGGATLDVDAFSGAAAGAELWAFLPPEFYGHIKRLYDNDPPIDFEDAVVPPAREPKPYGMDGPLTAYQDGSDAWVFASARRGGRFLYAFDVADIANDPGTVALKWKRGCPNLDDDTGCSTDFTGIGQTWSAPKIVKTNGYLSGGSAAPMLIFGGGYDDCEDADPHACTTSATGRQVYVLDADTGARLMTFTTDRPVVADIFVVPDGSTGLARYAYAADMGGNIYRISGATANATFGTTSPASWTMTKIASLGCDSPSDTSPSAGCAMNRKFMFAPDVAEKDGVLHLLIGSGDREKPIQAFDAAYGVQNYFFMVKDNPASAEWLTDETATCGSAIICLGSLVQIASGGADPDAADLTAAKGWALALRDHEQAVTSGITVFGTTTFSTHTPTVPAAGSCSSNLGTARVYNVRYANAAAINPPNNRDAEVAGGGLPPSPVAGMVELDDGTVVPFVIGADPDSPLESSLPSAPSSGTQPKSLTYWLTEK
jgi:type IV pilus assembly protein PilY1